MSYQKKQTTENKIEKSQSSIQERIFLTIMLLGSQEVCKGIVMSAPIVSAIQRKHK
jgi:hypothetical protein